MLPRIEGAKPNRVGKRWAVELSTGGKMPSKKKCTSDQCKRDELKRRYALQLKYLAELMREAQSGEGQR